MSTLRVAEHAGGVRQRAICATEIYGWERRRGGAAFVRQVHILEKASRLGDEHAEEVLDVGHLVLRVEPNVREEEVVLSRTRWIQRRLLAVKAQRQIASAFGGSAQQHEEQQHEARAVCGHEEDIGE